jgi:hypothetical protein
MYTAWWHVHRPQTLTVLPSSISISYLFVAANKARVGRGTILAHAGEHLVSLEYCSDNPQTTV